METPAEPASGELAYLFLRVNDAITYDITEGHPAIPIGMTQSGDKVFFTTAAQLDARRHRLERRPLPVERKRLAERPADGPLPGQRPGQLGLNAPTPGDRADAASNSSARNCRIRTAGLYVTPRGMDDLFAEDSGDIYFYSPENLDADPPGSQERTEPLRLPQRRGPPRRDAWTRARR